MADSFHSSHKPQSDSAMSEQLCIRVTRAQEKANAAFYFSLKEPIVWAQVISSTTEPTATSRSREKPGTSFNEGSSAQALERGQLSWDRHSALLWESMGQVCVVKKPLLWSAEVAQPLWELSEDQCQAPRHSAANHQLTPWLSTRLPLHHLMQPAGKGKAGVHQSPRSPSATTSLWV